jgi:hypothetical protein
LPESEAEVIHMSNKKKLPVSFSLLGPFTISFAVTAISSAVYDLVTGFGVRGSMDLMNGALVGALATLVMTPALLIAGKRGLRVSLALWAVLVVAHACLIFWVGRGFDFVENLKPVLAVAPPAAASALLIWYATRYAETRYLVTGDQSA